MQELRLLINSRIEWLMHVKQVYMTCDIGFYTMVIYVNVRLRIDMSRLDNLQTQKSLHITGIDLSTQCGKSIGRAQSKREFYFRDNEFEKEGTFELKISPVGLGELEKLRKNEDVYLTVSISGEYGSQDLDRMGSGERFVIARSDWEKMLDNCGYRKSKKADVPVSAGIKNSIKKIYNKVRKAFTSCQAISDLLTFVYSIFSRKNL